MTQTTYKTYRLLTVQFALLCLVIPWSLAAMQIMVGVICITFIIQSLIARKNFIRFHQTYYMMGLFLVALVIAALNSTNPHTGLQNVLHTNWIMLAVPVIASLPLKNEERIWAIRILILSSAVAGIYGIFQFFSGMDLIGDRELSMLGNFYRATGAYTFYLTFAGNQLMVFGLAFAMMMGNLKNKRQMWIYIPAVVIIGISMVATFGRSSWIGAGVILLTGTFFFYRKYFWRIMLLLGLTAVIFLIALPDIRERFLIIFDTSHKFNSGRINLWLTSWLMIKEYPWFGVGPGLFETFFHQFKVPGLYDATSHAHSDYLHMAVQTGIVGLTAWLSIWLAFYKVSFDYLRHQVNDLISQRIVQGIVLALAGILAAAFFQCYFVDLENSILWWVLVGIALQILIQKDQNSNKHSRP